MYIALSVILTVVLGIFGIFLFCVSLVNWLDDTYNKTDFKIAVFSSVVLISIICFWVYIYQTAELIEERRTEHKVHIVEGIPVYVNPYGNLVVLESHNSIYDTVVVSEKRYTGNFICDDLSQTYFKIVDKLPTSR